MMENIIVQKTAEKIRNTRKELGLSAEEVAERAGLKRATYYRYEGGDQKNMKLDKLQRIAEALDVHLAELIVWGEEKPAPLEEDGMDDLDKELLQIIHSMGRESKAALLAGLLSAQGSKE